MIIAPIGFRHKAPIKAKTLTDKITTLAQVLPLFFNLVKTMITIGVFDVTTGGEITPIARNGQIIEVRLPKRIASLYNKYLSPYYNNTPGYKFSSLDLERFIAAFNNGHQDANPLHGLASFFVRQPVMDRLATHLETLSILCANDATHEQLIARTVAQWIDATFAIKLSESDIEDLTQPEIEGKNYQASRALSEIHIDPSSAAPLELTFERIRNTKNLVITLATALATNLPIRSLTLIDCALDEYDRQLLRFALLQNTTLEQLSLQHIELGHTIVPQFQALTDLSLMSLDFVILTRLSPSTETITAASSSSQASSTPPLPVLSTSNVSASTSAVDTIISAPYALSLAGNHMMGNTWAIGLVQALLEGQLPIVSQLDLRGCNIDESGAQAILKELLAKQGELRLQAGSSTSLVSPFPLTALHLDETNTPQGTEGRNHIRRDTLGKIAAAVAGVPYTPSLGTSSCALLSFRDDVDAQPQTPERSDSPALSIDPQ